MKRLQERGCRAELIWGMGQAVGVQGKAVNALPKEKSRSVVTKTGV